MNVTIDPDSGFCFGVTHAIEVAERELINNNSLSCLGDIVHNDMEVERLKASGLNIIPPEELLRHPDSKVLIRAHGEPPETYKTARQYNIELIDATCPIVLKLQKRIRDAYREMAEKNGQVVIYGKQGHAEVIGLTGQTGGSAIVIGNTDELDKIDFSRPVRLFSQTTMSTEGFMEIVRNSEERIKQIFQDDPGDFLWNNTICRQVSGRSDQLRKFAQQYEVIIFVSGKKSSNGQYLYELCRRENPRSYFISVKEELQKEWFDEVRHVGICGATSTPKWLMEEVGEAVKRINK